LNGQAQHLRFYKPLAESRKIGVSPTANVVIGLHRRGGVTAVQADGGRDREEWVINSRGQMEGAWYDRTLSERLTSVTCHDRQTSTVKISNVLGFQEMEHLRFGSVAVWIAGAVRNCPGRQLKPVHGKENLGLLSAVDN